LTTQFQNAGSLQATIPAGLLTSPVTAQVNVLNPAGSPSNSVSFMVTPIQLNLAGLAPTSVPTQPTNISLSLSAGAGAQLDGTFTLTFQPNAAGVPPGYMDPGTRFAAGGTTLTFSIPAGSAGSVSLPQNGAIQQGTTAGVITVTLTRLVAGATNILPSSPPSLSITVPRLPPVIIPGSVQITGRSATGFNVELDAYSTPRDLTNATFTFKPAEGAELSGTTLTVPLASVAPAWFSSAGGLASGGAFHLTVPFTYSGDVGALGSVSVTLSDAAGPSTVESGS